jgi:choloylglycine hydrolase
MTQKNKIVFSLLLTVLLLLSSPLLKACTDFLIKSNDEAVVNGRSLEFAIDLDSKITVHPRGEARMSAAPNNSQGVTWTSQYGYIAVTAFDLDCAFDGMNEKGLSVGALWLPGSQYEDVTAANYDKALSVAEVANWMLSNFGSVDEVEQALNSVQIWGEEIPQMGSVPPLHFAIHDADGNSLVLELLNGEKRVHKNRIGVLTNAPQFEWHVLNLGNYLNLKAISANPVNLNGTVLSPPGQGSGLLGIPGDWMPPSRFVRVTAFKEFATKPEDAASAVSLAFHLLNTVDIPFGANGTHDQNTVAFDYTQWVVVKDLKNLQFYLRTYDDLNIRSIDFTKMDLETGTAVKSIPIEKLSSKPIDVSDQFINK